MPQFKVGANYGWLFTGSTPAGFPPGASASPPPPPPPPSAVNRPANPVAFCYATYGSGGANINSWARPGAVLVAGRDDYNDTWTHTAAAGGATVMIYLDVIINMTGGRYHGLLLNSSSYGAAVPLWPGPVVFNSYGSLNDIRTTADGGGGVLLSKLPGIIDLIVAENPHISGIFMDDLGSNGYFTAWTSSWSNAEKEKYRNAAIAIAQIVRSKADQYDLFTIFNGAWPAASGTQGSGGYPLRGTAGCSLTDGSCVEHPGIDGSWLTWITNDHGPGTQWGSGTPRGLSYPMFIVADNTERDFWLSHDLPAFVFVGSDYSGPPPVPWRSFTDFGMPRRS